MPEALSVQTLKHLAQSMIFSLTNLSTTSKISSPVVVAESVGKTENVLLYARSCEKGATSVDSSDCQLKHMDSFSFMKIWSLTSFNNSTILP